MSTSDSDIFWTVPGAKGFLWREFDAISVLYDPRSGEMHMLDAMSREVLDLLTDAPRTTVGVTAAVSEIMTGTPAERVEARVAEMIREFDRIGLIFPTLQGSA